MRLEGKVAIITGGGKGIGLRYVRGFAAAGAAVVVAEIDALAARGAAEEVRTSGGRVLDVPTDVADEASVQHMVDAAMSEFGRIDVLINNAALFAAAWNERVPSELLTVEQWDRMFAVNVRGTWLCCKHVVPHMREHDGGSIINIASGTAWKGSAGFLHYVTSKAAIAGMTRALAREYGASGKIRVNCIAPGLIPTGIASFDRAPVMRMIQPLKRQGQPRDVANAALFLASERSAQTTGIVLPVDGGTTVGAPTHRVMEIMAAQAKPPAQ